MKTALPDELVPIREAARRTLGPVLPAGQDTLADNDFLFSAKRTDASKNLPPQHLIYFLMVDLLGFKDLGKFEKLAWSIPIDFHGRAFLIEHRKFGVGVFAHDLTTEEVEAEKIVIRVRKAVKVAKPFFDWLAEKAIERSSVNVINNSESLFDRLQFFLREYHAKIKDAHDRKDERIVKRGGTEKDRWESITFPAMRLRVEARWLGLAAIEAFFSWTEHVFIHIGILSGAVRTASEVAKLAAADWATKYKGAIGLTDAESKVFYDKLLTIRQELRNFVAHGSFGKQGEAFDFHSSAGAVPVLLPRRAGKFSFGEHLAFDVEGPIQIIEAFIPHIWSGSRAPTRIYVQEYQLPLILTMASDGRYAEAMKSTSAMKQFAGHLAGQFDQAANMDW